MAYDKDNQGAFWLARDRNTREPKLTSKGTRYWTGTITINGVQHSATMFHNPENEKKNPAAPDFSISINAPHGQQSAPMDAVKERMKQVAPPMPIPSQARHADPNEVIRVEDIPF